MFPINENRLALIRSLISAFLLFLATDAGWGQIQITEIHYNSGNPVGGPGQPSEDTLEFIEIHNEGDAEINLSGYRFSSGIQFEFPQTSRIGPGEFKIISKNANAFESRYGFAPDWSPFGGVLNNGGEKIELRDADDASIWEAGYNDRGDWPAEADGAGYSLVYEKFGDSPKRGRNWNPSREKGGSPGNWDNPQNEVGRELVLIEKNSPVRYFKGLSEPSNATTEWTQIDFDESNDWLSGRSGIGYSSQANELAYLSTLLNDMRGRYLSVYCRFQFSITVNQLEELDTLVLNHAYDDGYVIYLNGKRIASANVNGTPPRYDQNSTTGSDYSPVSIDMTTHKDLLVSGKNILAIQGHNIGVSSSSDFVIAPTLTATLKRPTSETETWESILINEILANTVEQDDFVEIYNPTEERIDLSGYHLHDSPAGEPKYTLPQGTFIEPRGLLAFMKEETGISLSSLGEKIFLLRPDKDVVVDAYGWGEHNPEVGIGRIPDGSQNWFFTSSLTPGTSNIPTREVPIVINEIHYHDPDGERFEFIELKNLNDTLPIDLTGWHFIGIDYRFPERIEIAGGALLTLCDNRQEASRKFGVPLSQLHGDYGGGLRDKGESIAILNSNDVVIDLVSFDNNVPWPISPDGLGASLERSCIEETWDKVTDWVASPIGTPSPAKENSIQGCMPAITPAIRISEIQYNSSIEREDDRNLEFIELVNISREAIAIGGWLLAGDIFYTFPDGTTILGGERILAAYHPDRTNEYYKLDGIQIFGPYDGELPNGGGEIVLIGGDGQLVDHVEYDDDFPWPSLADGVGSVRGPGKSLTRIESMIDTVGPVSWTAENPTPGDINNAPSDKSRAAISSLTLEPQLITASSEPILTINFPDSYTPEIVEVEFFLDDIVASNETKSRDIATRVDNGVWQFKFGKQAANSIIRYRIHSSFDGESMTSPASNRDQFDWHGYFVDPEVTTNQPNQYHLMISPFNWIKLHAWTDGGRVQNGKPNPTWNNEVPATFIGDGRVFDVMVRHQGSRWNRRNGSTINFDCFSHNSDNSAQVRSWRIDFPSYRRFRGMDVLILQKQSGWPQRVSFAMFEMAGVPAPRTSWADLRINGCEYNPDAFQIERPGRDLVERWFGEVGDLFKSQGFTGNEGPWSWGDARLIRGSLNGFTESQRYKYTYNRKSLNFKSDETDLLPDDPESMIEALHEARQKGTEELRNFLAETFDVNLTLRYICTINYVGTFDDMFQNHYLYRRADNGKWCMFPWDMDNTLGGAFGQSNAHPFRGVNESRYGNVGNRGGWWNRIKDSFFIAYPEEFLQMFHYLNNNVYSPDKLRPVVESIAREGGRSGSVNSLMNHATSRYNYLNNFIEDALTESQAGLAIEQTATRIKVSWPGTANFSVLQSARSAQGPWTDIESEISFDGTMFHIFIRPEPDSLFFRLR